MVKGGLGQSKIISYEKLSGNDKDNTKIGKCGSYIGFCYKSRLTYDRRDKINLRIMSNSTKKVSTGENFPILTWKVYQLSTFRRANRNKRKPYF